MVGHVIPQYTRTPDKIWPTVKIKEATITDHWSASLISFEVTKENLLVDSRNQQEATNGIAIYLGMCSDL